MLEIGWLKLLNFKQKIKNEVMKVAFPRFKNGKSFGEGFPHTLQQVSASGDCL